MNNRHDKILFWGCFIALITTSYAFISRMILCGGQFKADFGLDNVVAGELQGVAFAGARGKHLAHPARRDRRVAGKKQRDLLRREPAEIRQENIALG